MKKREKIFKNFIKKYKKIKTWLYDINYVE
jgi:hypothetical protein